MGSDGGGGSDAKKRKISWDVFGVDMMTCSWKAFLMVFEAPIDHHKPTDKSLPKTPTMGVYRHI